MDFHAYASSSAGNAFAVTADGLPPLGIECGLPMRLLRRCLRVPELAGVLVSHHHGDHARAAGDLMRSGVDVYASEPTWAALELDGHRAHRLVPREPVSIRGWRVLPFALQHDAEGCLGFLVEPEHGDGRLLYACDTAYVPVRANGCTHIAIEANYSGRLLRQGVRDVEARIRVLENHMSLERAIEMLQANDLSAVQEVWLLHLSDDHADELEFQREVERATGKPVHVAPRLAPFLTGNVRRTA